MIFAEPVRGDPRPTGSVAGESDGAIRDRPAAVAR